MKLAPIAFALFAAAAALSLAAVPTAAQQFELPQGFAVEPAPRQDEPRPGGAEEQQDWQPLFTVRPDEGPFADLSSITLGRVEGSVADPEAWLAGRLSTAFPEARDAERLFTSPDSPFADPFFDAIREALPELFGGLDRIGELPLEFCDAPSAGYNASGKFHERFCTFSVGPVRKYLVLRLQQLGDAWFYTRITTMNERRLRDLLSIADTFHVRA